MQQISRLGCVGGITSTGTNFCVLNLVLRCLLKALGDEMSYLMAECVSAKGKVHHVHRHCSSRLVTLRFCFGKISELKEQINQIYGIFILLLLTYHNTFFQLEVFDTLRNVYNWLLYGAEFDPGDLNFYFWMNVDGGKILVYFLTAALYVREGKKLKVTICLFTNELSSCKLRESVCLLKC
jgi:hypothetical protein